MEQLKVFASYTYRLDYDRGSDDYGPRDGQSMFGRLGIEVPAHSARIGAGTAAR